MAPAEAKARCRTKRAGILARERLLSSIRTVRQVVKGMINPRLASKGLLLIAPLFSWLALSIPAQTVQLVSTPDPSQSPPAGGGGDSWNPILSADGRYVLFASVANNLVLTTNRTPLPSRFPARLNVFVHDRTNGTTSLVSV